MVKYAIGVCSVRAVDFFLQIMVIIITIDKGVRVCGNRIWRIHNFYCGDGAGDGREACVVHSI